MSKTKQASTSTFKAFENYVLTKNIFLAHHAAKKPLLIWGSSGNGKSSMVANWVKELGEEIFILPMANKSALDTFALAVDNGKTIEHPAWWIKKLCDQVDENGNEYSDMVLFLDEITRAHDSMETIIMEMASDHKICGRPMRKNIFLVAASNFGAEDAGKKDLTLNQASLRRFTHVTNYVTFNTTVNVLKGSAKKIAMRIGQSYDNYTKQYNFFDDEMGMPHDQLACNRQFQDASDILDSTADKYGVDFLSDREIRTITCGRLGLELGELAASEYVSILEESKKAKKGEIYVMPEELSYEDFDKVEGLESARRIELSKTIGTKMSSFIKAISEEKDRKKKEELKAKVVVYCHYLYEKAEPETVSLVFAELGVSVYSTFIVPTTRDGKMVNRSLAFILGRSGARKFAVNAVESFKSHVQPSL